MSNRSSGARERVDNVGVGPSALELVVGLQAVVEDLVGREVVIGCSGWCPPARDRFLAVSWKLSNEASIPIWKELLNFVPTTVRHLLLDQGDGQSRSVVAVGQSLVEVGDPTVVPRAAVQVLGHRPGQGLDGVDPSDEDPGAQMPWPCGVVVLESGKVGWPGGSCLSTRCSCRQMA